MKKAIYMLVALLSFSLGINAYQYFELRLERQIVAFMVQVPGCIEGAFDQLERKPSAGIKNSPQELGTDN